MMGANTGGPAFPNITTDIIAEVDVNESFRKAHAQLDAMEKLFAPTTDTTPLITGVAVAAAAAGNGKRLSRRSLLGLWWKRNTEHVESLRIGAGVEDLRK